jgi:hypothetical protein
LRKFFKPQLSYAYLHQEYVVEQKSTYTIAKQVNSYAQMIRRELIHYGIPLRDHSSAQVAALKTGSSINPKTNQTNQIKEQNGQNKKDS